MSSLLLMLVAASEVAEFAEGSRWLFNDALLALDEAAHQHDRVGWWRRSVRDVVGYTPAVVMPVDGDPSNVDTVDTALHELLGDELVVRVSLGAAAMLQVTARGMTLGRRRLFSLTADDAELIYEVGRKLARCLSTSSKNWERSASGSNVRSSKPASRLQLVPGL